MRTSTRFKCHSRRGHVRIRTDQEESQPSSKSVNRQQRHPRFTICTSSHVRFRARFQLQCQFLDLKIGVRKRYKDIQPNQ
jgi:hypothetical protein